ncbi:hypothetical protein VOLCADRAFT_94720 [Volvox carteri f. nagariensis]|uniref:Uncharacterized protein n=1 Tax=Volvox carteri f. nagariensis TaxID=3068 RepID=D8U5K0_VOLCA|nr:uncharacterized protein VOLCADRAFT_94720 [Volvox carteri f. nagariensis]EFJ45015.1 hypothetical protein VOLCADRAFT_94720 [Volvox carteri f. nagariensis]|eukprot:XP_002953986.1 hypothetical protein VOLCADRAFT_94720 [Volvox carteri f. nagariensis]
MIGRTTNFYCKQFGKVARSHNWEDSQLRNSRAQPDTRAEQEVSPHMDVSAYEEIHTHYSDTGKHRCPALQGSLDYTEADVAVLRRMEDIAPEDIDQARGLPGLGGDEEPGATGEPRRQVERHHGDASRGPVGAERDEDVLGSRGHGYEGGSGGGGGFRSGSSTLWGTSVGAEVVSPSSGSGMSDMTGIMDDAHAAEWSPAQTAELAAKGITLGSEAQVREVEQLISGGTANTGDMLSHPERFGGHSDAPGTFPSPPPRYRGHLAADQHTATVMGSQGAVRAVEAAISLSTHSTSSAAGSVAGSAESSGEGSAGNAIPAAGHPGEHDSSGSRGEVNPGGIAGAAAVMGSKAARSLEGVVDVARTTARSAGQMLGNAARHLTEEDGSKERKVGTTSAAAEPTDNTPAP